MISTFDSSKTPRAGEVRIEPKTLAQVDMTAIAAALAKAKADKEPKKAPAKAAAAAPAKDALAVEYQRGLGVGKFIARQVLAAERKRAFDEGAAKGIATALKGFRDELDAIMPRVEKAMDKVLREVKPAPAVTVEAAADEAGRITGFKVKRDDVKLLRTRRFERNVGADVGAFSGGEQKVVDALAFWRSLGFDNVEFIRACVVAGYSPKASTFRGYVSGAKQAGLIEYPRPGRIMLTPEGLARATEPVGDFSTLQERAASILDGPARRVFEYLCDQFPAGVTHESICEKLGLSPEASTARGYVSEVTSLGLAEKIGPGVRRAPAWLFQNAN